MKTTLPPGYHARPARMDDVEAAVEMFNLDSRRLIGADEFILQEEGNEWQTPGFNLATDSQVVLTEDDQLVGIINLDNILELIKIQTAIHEQDGQTKFEA